MTEKAKLPLILLVVLLILSLTVAGFGFYLLQEERAKNFELQDKLEEVTLTLRRTEQGLNEYKKKSADLEGQLKTAQDNIESLNGQIEEEKKLRQEAESKLDVFEQDLEQQKGLKSSLEKKLNQALEDAAKTQARLKELEDKRVELEAKVTELEKRPQEVPEIQGVELGKIVVSPETSVTASASKTKKPAAKTEKKAKKADSAKVKPEKKKADKVIATGPQGRVLVVNKEYGFVVISLGSRNKIALDDVFAIYHEDKYIGDVKVEKLEESMSAAGFLSDSIKNKVSKDDKAVKKEK